MQANNKNIIVAIGAVLLFAFFMPWVKIFINLSAWDMVFGDVGQVIDTPFRFVSVIIPIVGMLVIYGAVFNNENYPLSTRFLFLLPFFTLLLIVVIIVVKFNNMGLSMRSSDIGDLIKIFGIGFWSTLIASVILLFQKNHHYPKTPTQNDHIRSTITDNQQRTPITNQPNVPDTQVNTNSPKINWNKKANDVRVFIGKNKAVLLGGTLLLIVWMAIYNFFIKADPVKDGKAVAKDYCKCSEELNKNNLVSLQSYLTDFSNKKFKSRSDAHTLLNSVLQESQIKYSGCIQNATMKYTQLLTDYNAKGGQNALIFQQTYNSIISICSNSTGNEVAALQNQIDGKIKKIVDPEPDIEKIKSDLLGREVTGWTFSYLNEFRTAEIIHTVKSNERIEYQIKFDLVDNITNTIVLP